jgi:hypothetical protein
VLRPSDIVLGVEFGGIAKAYPVRILNWHEVVNDDVGQQPVLVSWCPLCGSGVVYDPQQNGQRYRFGVSGLLYKRNLLLYDQETESLWSQLGGAGVTGPMAGTSLRLLPVTETTWAHWKSEHSGTLVLSFRTGFHRDYAEDPYRDWQMDRRQTLVVLVNGKAKLYPFSELMKAVSPVADEFTGLNFAIVFDAKDQVASVRGAERDRITSFVAFLADARAFYPDAPTYKAQ